MAARNPPPSDIAAIAGTLNVLSRAKASLANQFERMRDVPTSDAGERVPEAIAALPWRVDERLTLMDVRLVPMRVCTRLRFLLVPAYPDNITLWRSRSMATRHIH